MTDQQLIAERDKARAWAERAYALLKEAQAMHRDCFFLSNKGPQRDRGLAWMEKIREEVEAYETPGQTAPAGLSAPKP